MSEFNTQVVSLIRTIVPLIVGQILTWAAAQGIIDSTGQVSALLIVILTTAFTTAYYTIARYLETFVSSKFGWLLGAAKAPNYEK